MKIKYDYLYAVEYSKPDLMDESGYKYVIPGLYTAYRTDKGFEHFKEIYNLIGKTQPIKYHPEGDSYNHTMIVVDNSSKLTTDLKIKFS